jgi:hypothetical protein
MPMLDFCLVEFPKEEATVPRCDIDLARHPQCFEVLVPNFGEITWLGVTSTHRDHDAESHTVLKNFRAKGREVHEERLVSVPVSGIDVPDVFVLDSAYFHAFVANGCAAAGAFHLRCYDYDLHGDHRRVGDDKKRQAIDSKWQEVADEL